MMKTNTKFLLLLSILFVPGVVFAQYGLDQTAQGAGLTKYSGDISVIIGNLIGSALAIIGVIFFLLMVYGGFLWMTDRGKGEYMERAKEAIIAAVIGLVIVLGAYAITNFVFSSVEENAGNVPNQDPVLCQNQWDACIEACPADPNPAVIEECMNECDDRFQCE